LKDQLGFLNNLPQAQFEGYNKKAIFIASFVEYTED